MSGTSYSYAFGPLVAIVAFAVLMVLLRWAFSSGKTSLVQRRVTEGKPDEYGLLVRVAAPPTQVEAELIRRRLVDAGLRATLAPTTEGPAVMVFAEDASSARDLLKEI